MVRQTFKVKITPRNIQKSLGRARKQLRPHVQRMVKELAEFGVSTMRANVPVRTGRLRTSIRILSRSSSGGFDLRSTIFIGSNVPYAAAQDTGAKPSSGRYVPDLGRRVSSGRHPGFKGRNFSAITQRAILDKSNLAVDKLVARLKRDVRRG